MACSTIVATMMSMGNFRLASTGSMGTDKDGLKFTLD